LVFPTYVIDYRPSSLLSVGMQLGWYPAKRARVAARLIKHIDIDGDSYGDDPDLYYGDVVDGWGSSDPAPPEIYFGGSVGFVAVSRTRFVMSPSLFFMRSEMGEYGSVLGISFPLEWVHRGGLRIGVEPALGYGFGGSQREVCVEDWFCEAGSFRRVDRRGGPALYAQFQFGYGLGYPDPLPAK
jgi:hypothetical protein